MGTRQVLLSPNTPATRHLAYFDGTIYSALSKNLLILTIEACKTFIIASCPFEWKGTLTTKARTANLSGHRLLWTAGELCRWQSRTTKSARDWLESGSLKRSTEHCIVSQSTRTRKAVNQGVSRHPSHDLEDRMNINFHNPVNSDQIFARIFPMRIGNPCSINAIPSQLGI